MMAAFRAFKIATKVDEDDCPDTLDTTEFTEINFVDCGAHRLNNTIQDPVNHITFFKQVNNFCKENGGPDLSLTRWHGHVRQVELKHLVLRICL